MHNANSTLPKTGLPELLRAVSAQGWNSPAGTEAVTVMQQFCRWEASQWWRTAGTLTDEGLAEVWEQMDRLVRNGRVEQAPGVLRIAARRAYAGEAAARHTGMGQSTTRGLIREDAAHRGRRLAQLDDTRPVPADDAAEWVAPRWMQVLADVLNAEGWQWPVPALDAVIATAACGNRAHRSPLAGHDTGVPAAAWSALDLLILGSGPGCSPARAHAGVAVLIKAHGCAGLYGTPAAMHYVRGAVTGRPVRTVRGPIPAEWRATA